MNRQTRNHTYIHSEYPVWFGSAQTSHRAQGRKKEFPMQLLFQFRDILQTERRHAMSWKSKTEVLIKGITGHHRCPQVYFHGFDLVSFTDEFIITLQRLQFFCFVKLNCI